MISQNYINSDQQATTGNSESNNSSLNLNPNIQLTP